MTTYRRNNMKEGIHCTKQIRTRVLHVGRDARDKKVYSNSPFSQRTKNRNAKEKGLENLLATVKVAC